MGRNPAGKRETGGKPAGEPEDVRWAPNHPVRVRDLGPQRSLSQIRSSRLPLPARYPCARRQIRRSLVSAAAQYHRLVLLAGRGRGCRNHVTAQPGSPGCAIGERGR
jgi:hypothetical protein